MTKQELKNKILEAQYRLDKTTKGSRCWRDTKKWLERLKEQERKQLWAR